jgi:hypothetical protein
MAGTCGPNWKLDWRLVVKGESPKDYQGRPYRLVCPEHGPLGRVIGAHDVAVRLVDHGCELAYAEPVVNYRIRRRAFEVKP